MNEKTANSASGWTVVIAALAINLILGVLYAWGVIGKALAGDWGWSKADATLPFTVATACFAIMMVFAGRCQDKFGPRLVATAGGVILGLGLIASGLVHTPLAMALTFGVGAGLGIGLGYSATTPPAIKWFPPARKGLITGIVVSGVGLAAVYIAPLTQYLLKSFAKSTNISTTFFCLGAGTLVLVPLLAQLLRNPPTQPLAQAASTSTAAVSRPESDWQAMLGTIQFYQIWLMMVLSASAGLMIITQVAVIAKEQANWSWGFMPIATLAIFNSFGRLLSGVVSDRIGRTRTMALAFLLQAGNMMIFSFYNTPALLVFGSAFTGLCYGTIFTLMPVTTADFYGVRNLGVNYGLVFTAFGVAGVVGPYFSARIRDHFGSYFYAFWISAGMLVLGSLLGDVDQTARGPGRADNTAIESFIRRPSLKPKTNFNLMNSAHILTTLALAGPLALSQAQTTVSTNGTSAPPPEASGLEQTIKNIKNPLSWLSWGGDLRIRNEYSDNAASLGVPPGGLGFGNVHAQDYFRFRGRIWASLFPTNDLTFNVRLASEPREFLERSTFDSFYQVEGPQWRYGIFDNLNVQWKQPLKLPATLTLGRQDIFLGDGWLVGDASPNDGSFTTFFDAARLTYKLEDQHTTIDAIGLLEFARPDAWLPTLGASTGVPPPSPLSLPLTLTDQDEKGAILWVANNSLPYANLDGYFIYKHDTALHDPPVPIFGDSGDIYTLGGRVSGLVQEHWKYSAEGAYQFGRKNDPELNQGGANPDLAPSAQTTGYRGLNSFGVNSKLTYQFHDRWNDQASLSYEYLTGDNPKTGGDEMFDVLWGRWPSWSEMYNVYGYIQETRVGQTANLHRIGPTWTLNPLPKMELSASYFILLADQEVPTRDFNHAIFGNSQPSSDAFSGTGDDRGQYVQAVLKYKFNQHLSGHLWSEFLLPGNFYNNRQMMSFLRAEIMYAF